MTISYHFLLNLTPLTATNPAVRLASLELVQGGLRHATLVFNGLRHKPLENARFLGKNQRYGKFRLKKCYGKIHGTKWKWRMCLMTPEGGRMAAADLFHQSCSVVEPPWVKCESQSGKHSAQRKVRCPDVSCWISHRMVQHFGTAVLI